MANRKAVWSVELNVECPACTKYVDLLETAGFMCDAPFEIYARIIQGRSTWKATRQNRTRQWRRRAMP